MMLGQTLNQLARTSDESVALSLLPDLVLLARTRAAAAAAGQSLNAYVLAACQDFLNGAAEEEWTTLMGHLRDGDEAGATLVQMAVERRLRPECCGCGGDVST